MLDTPPAVLLAIEYLLRQTYVDKRQVELVGASLGAFFVAIPAAIDNRISRVWLIHGAGRPEVVLRYRLKKYIKNDNLRSITARGLALITATRFLKPEVWVQKIKNRPVIVVSAHNDTEYPPSSVKALHLALPENGEIIWMDGLHVRPHRRQVIDEIIALVVKRIGKD